MSPNGLGWLCACVRQHYLETSEATSQTEGRLADFVASDTEFRPASAKQREGPAPVPLDVWHVRDVANSGAYAGVWTERSGCAVARNAGLV